MQAFGIEPRVAMLSYSTLGSGAGPDVQRVVDATALVKQLRPDLMVEGPIQYDAAIDPAVAAVKVKTSSEVAGGPRCRVLVSGGWCGRSGWLAAGVAGVAGWLLVWQGWLAGCWGVDVRV